MASATIAVNPNRKFSPPAGADYPAANQAGSFESSLSRLRHSDRRTQESAGLSGDQKNEKENGMGKLAGTATGMVKKASAGPLTTFWGSVWLDWTLASLLYLNGHLAASLLLPNWVCQFGEDNCIGKISGFVGKDTAKILEIILLAILDAVVLTLLLVILYFIYDLINHPLGGIWNILWGATKGILTGEGALNGIIERNIENKFGG